MNFSPPSQYGSPYFNHPQYGGMGYPSQYGMYGYSGMPSDNLWQGVLGNAAESLGRVNNLLTMTGMLVDHISNHVKMIYTKASEFHDGVVAVRQWSERHSEWMERLGLQIESGWTGEDEQTRKKRMQLRRARTIGIIVLIGLFLAYALRRGRGRSSHGQGVNSDTIRLWENVYRNYYQTYSTHSRNNPHQYPQHQSSSVPFSPATSA